MVIYDSLLVRLAQNCDYLFT